MRLARKYRGNQNYMIFIDENQKDWVSQFLPNANLHIIILNDIKNTYLVPCPLTGKKPVIPNNRIKILPSLINLNMKQTDVDIIQGTLNIEEYLFLIDMLEDTRWGEEE